MYAFAPVSHAALHRSDGDRPRSYRVPLPALVLPAAFCSANLVIYWGGFESAWKIACAMLAGLALFAVGAWRRGTGARHTLRSALWIGPWLGGQVVIGALGRYGGGSNWIPNWVDIAVVVAFSLAIFHGAVRLTLSKAATAAAIAKDAHQIDYAAPAR
jgi:hypothetical protein